MGGRETAESETVWTLCYLHGARTRLLLHSRQNTSVSRGVAFHLQVRPTDGTDEVKKTNGWNFA
jgi:hypothetical protein